MGKLTFRRVVTVLKRNLLISTLPIMGGSLFLAGSFFFWPGATRGMINFGALCFLAGSLCYWAAPFLDFWELTHNHSNLLEPPPGAALALTAADTHKMAAVYEHLYKSHILRIQCANCLVYMLGGGFFVAGSTLFFPAMEEIVYHGGWLYITGCVITLTGALLAMFTAFEMKRTALPMRFASPPSLFALPFWTDEGAAIASCTLYIGGNATFIVGSVCFFPKVLPIAPLPPPRPRHPTPPRPSLLSQGGARWPASDAVHPVCPPQVIEAGGVLVEMLAVILFILGSVLFTAGAVIDLIVLARAPLLVRPSTAPQMRGLTLGHGRALGSKQLPARKYQPMRNDPEADPPASPLAAATAGVEFADGGTELGILTPATQATTPSMAPVCARAGRGGGAAAEPGGVAVDAAAAAIARGPLSCGDGATSAERLMASHGQREIVPAGRLPPAPERPRAPSLPTAAAPTAASPSAAPAPAAAVIAAAPARRSMHVHEVAPKNGTVREASAIARA